MNKLIILSLILATFIGYAIAADKADRKPAAKLVGSGVDVYEIKDSGAAKAEKWVDSSQGVVCYVIDGSISCVKR